MSRVTITSAAAANIASVPNMKENLYQIYQHFYDHQDASTYIEHIGYSQRVTVNEF